MRLLTNANKFKVTCLFKVTLVSIFQVKKCSQQNSEFTHREGKETHNDGGSVEGILREWRWRPKLKEVEMMVIEGVYLQTFQRSSQCKREVGRAKESKVSLMKCGKGRISSENVISHNDTVGSSSQTTNGPHKIWICKCLIFCSFWFRF
ncbi:hypothetical protein MTR_3g093630 [Medicago truncatula]|uniref:Uncharacterized protein n=1 Tax=Medicago truncatula TaxID=3880 RepID=A0A072V1E4_MEDTR|nr:hypothetical protein MTR_3g093630 [Medicago truncatula]